MAQNHQAQRHDVVRQIEYFPYRQYAVLHRVQAAPDRTQISGARGQHEVLGGGGTILYPETGGFFFIEIRADHDHHRRVGGHFGIGMPSRQGRAHLGITHHHKVPGLPVAGAGSQHGRLEQDVQVFIADVFLSVFADAAPGEQGFKNIHLHVSS